MTKKTDYKNHKWHKVLNVISDQKLTCEKKNYKWWKVMSEEKLQETKGNEGN